MSIIGKAVGQTKKYIPKCERAALEKNPAYKAAYFLLNILPTKHVAKLSDLMGGTYTLAGDININQGEWAREAFRLGCGGYSGIVYPEGHKHAGQEHTYKGKILSGTNLRIATDEDVNLIGWDLVSEVAQQVWDVNTVKEEDKKKLDLGSPSPTSENTSTATPAPTDTATKKKKPKEKGRKRTRRRERGR